MIGRLAPAAPSPSPGGTAAPVQSGGDFAALFATLAPAEDEQAIGPGGAETDHADAAPAEVDPAAPPSPEALLALVASLPPAPSVPPAPTPAAPAPDEVEPHISASGGSKSLGAPVMEVLDGSPRKGGIAPDAPKEAVIVPVQERPILPMPPGAPPAAPARLDIAALIDAPAPAVGAPGDDRLAEHGSAGAEPRAAEPREPRPSPLPLPPAPLPLPLTPALAPARAQALDRLEPAPPRDGALPTQSPGPALAPIAPQNIAAPPPLPPPPPMLAASLAGQLAAAFPRMRSEGGETVLTLEPARLGRVTLAWQEGAGAASVLSVRAADPATAALLTRLGEDLTAMLRADPAVAQAQGSDFRLDIARAERPAEARSPEPRGGDTGGQAAAQDNSAGMGQSRHQHRAPHLEENRAQVLPAAAVNADEDDAAATLRSDRAEGRARLA